MIGFDYEKFNKGCYVCAAKDNLTIHHLKNHKGNKTGHTQILCRPCHDQAEEEYRLYGIIPSLKKIKQDSNQKLEIDSKIGKIPFYSSK